MTRMEDPNALEVVLLPLLDPDSALDFLRRAAADILREMEQEVTEAAQQQARELLRRIAKLRRHVQKATTLEELRALSDPKLLPQLVLEPDSDIWRRWPHPHWQKHLADLLDSIHHLQQALDAMDPKGLTYHQLREKLRLKEEELLNLGKQILLAWLDDQERRIREGLEHPQPLKWNIVTHLQIPLVVEGKVLDFIDAELTATVSTAHAYLSRTFYVVIIPRKTSLVEALRRINLIRHFTPPDTVLIVVAFDPLYVPVLKQHNAHVYIAEEAETTDG